jgi:DNA polymerase-3 subunit delta
VKDEVNIYLTRLSKNKVNTQAAIQAIHEKKLAPLYLVLGTEEYLQEQIKQAFKEKMVIEGEDDLNFLAFDLTENTMADVLAEAETLPFFGDNRLVFVDNSAFLTGDKKASLEEEAVKSFIEYLKAPLESTILVFFAPYPKLDERKKVTKNLKKQAQIIDVNPPKEHEVRNFLQQTLQIENIKMSREAFELFLRLTGMNLSKLMQEMGKLALYAGNGQTVGIETIRSLVPKTLEDDIFELTSFILKGDTDHAIRLYDDLHLQGIETIQLSAILLSQIRLFIQTKILLQMGYQQSNIAETLAIHPYRVKLAMQQVSRLSLPYLTTMYDQLIENDYLTKTGQNEKEFAFQLFILKNSRKAS